MRVFYLPAKDDNKAIFREWETGDVIEDYEGEFTYYPSNINAGACRMHTWMEGAERAFSCYSREEYNKKFPEFAY